MEKETLHFTINKRVFVAWYLDKSSEESQSILKDINDRMINALHYNGSFKITAEELLNECNQSEIPVNLTDVRYGHQTNLTLGEFSTLNNTNFEITLSDAEV